MKSLNLLKKSKNRSFIGGFIGSFLSATGVLATAVTVLGSSVYADTVLKTFTSNGTLLIPDNAQAGSFEILVVGGGGGGGSSVGGGGGAGRLVRVTGGTLSSGTYTITVGAGGSGATAGNNNAQNGGVSSIMLGATTIISCSGGGAGGTTANNGSNGGSSGGGGGWPNANSSTSGGSFLLATVNSSIGGAVENLGYAGGQGKRNNSNQGSGGGGGGAMNAGTTSTYTSVSAGGAGYELSITGSPKVYAEGGNGKPNTDETAGGAREANTGSGGHAGGGGQPGGAGADGIVVVKYTTGTPPPAGNAYTWDVGSVENKTWNDANNWDKKNGYPSQTTDVAIYSKASDALTKVDATHSFGILTNNAPNQTTIIYGDGNSNRKLDGQIFYAAADTTTIFSNGVKATFYPSEGWAENMLKNTATGNREDPEHISFMGDRAKIVATGEGTVLTISSRDDATSKQADLNNSPGHNLYTYVLKGEDQELIAENGATLILSNMNYASAWQAAQEDRNLGGYYDVVGDYAYQKLRNIQHTVTGTGTRMMLQWYLDDQSFGHPAAEKASFVVTDGATLEFMTDQITANLHRYAFNAGGMSQMNMVISNATVLSHGYLQLSPSEEVSLFVTDADTYYHTITIVGTNSVMKFDYDYAAQEWYSPKGAPVGTFVQDESGAYGIRLGRYVSETRCNVSFVVEPEWADKSTARIISESTPENNLTLVTDTAKDHQQSWFQMGRNSKLKIDVSHLNYRTLDELTTKLENTVGASNVMKLSNGNSLIPLIRHGRNEQQGSFILSTFLPEITYPTEHQWVVRLVHVDADGNNYQVWKNDQQDQHKPAGTYYLEFYTDPNAFVIGDYVVPYLGQTNDYYDETHDFGDTSEFIKAINIHSVMTGEILQADCFDITIKDILTGLERSRNSRRGNKEDGTLAYTDVGECIISAVGKTGTPYENLSATGIFKITPATLTFNVQDYHLESDRDLTSQDVAVIKKGYTKAGSLEENDGVLESLKLLPSGDIEVQNNWNASNHQDPILTLPEIEIRNYTVEKYPGEITFEENKLYSIYYYKPENVPTVEGPKITVAGTWWKEAYPGLFNQAGTKVKDVDGKWYDFVGSETTSKWYESLQREFMKTNTWGVAGWEAYILGFDGSQVSNACVVTSISQYGPDNVLIELKDMPTGQIPEEKDGFELQGKHTTQLQLTSATVSDNADVYSPWLSNAVKGRSNDAWPNWIIPTADAANKRFRLRVLYDFGNIKTGSN